MTKRYKLAALVILLLQCDLTPALAQSEFTMTTQKFDHSKNDWAAPLERAHFKKNANGDIDSVVVEYYKDSTFRVFTDWHRVSWHLDTVALHKAPRQFTQLGTLRKTPLRTEYYSVVAGDTSLISYDSMYMEDTLLKAYLIGVTPKGYEARHYLYSPAAELICRYVEGYLNGEISWDYIDTIERTYDDKGRNSKVVFRTGQNKRTTWDVLDSQILVYNDDNTLRTGIEWRYVEKRLSIQQRYEFLGWHRYEANSYGFKIAPLMVGGPNYSKYVNFRWDDDSGRFVHMGIVEQRFNDLDQLEEASTQDTSSGVTVGRYSYYPNGDAKQRLYKGANDSSFTAYNFDNVYTSDGRLLSSTWTYGGLQLWKYTFEYPGFSRVSSPEPRSEVGTLPEGRHLTVYSTLGVKVFETAQSSPDRFSFLTSGLYFISIDGGRPRKHLIP